MRLITRLREYFHLARGGAVEFELGPYRRVLASIDEHDFEGADDEQLKHKSGELAARAGDGVALERLLPEAFALVRETSHRVLAMQPFDTQMIAGIAMHQGKLAEMPTGEGKTLAAVAPVYLSAITGRGVHVLTFNDYLARRDAQWMGPAYRFLGLSVGCVQQQTDIAGRKDAYTCDVTYLTAKQAGFDYLRDHLSTDPSDLVHRPLNYAIVDEADSILIDEARVPLVIAGSTEAVQADPARAVRLVGELLPDRDFKTMTSILACPQDTTNYRVADTLRSINSGGTSFNISSSIGCRRLHCASPSGPATGDFSSQSLGTLNSEPSAYNFQFASRTKHRKGALPGPPLE